MRLRFFVPLEQLDRVPAEVFGQQRGKDPLDVRKGSLHIRRKFVNDGLHRHRLRYAERRLDQLREAGAFQRRSLNDRAAEFFAQL